MISEDNVLLYLVRHGETKLNKEHRFRGTVNAPLDADGFREANRLAEYFRNIDLTHIFTSPKKRTATTAGIIALAKNMCPIENDSLLPWDIGKFGGMEKTDENIRALHYYIEHPEIPPPGGKSLNYFRSQIHPIVEEGIEEAEKMGAPMLWVCHSSVVHEASALITGDHSACKVKPGGVVAIYVGPGNKIYAEPILKPDKSAATQNILGTSSHATTIS